jgi:hypothetical protein
MLVAMQGANLRPLIRRGLRVLHLADTGVYKKELILLRKHLISLQVGGELA